MTFLLQTVIIVFTLFALSRIYLRFREGKVSKGEALFWTLIWCAVVVLVFIPQVTDYFADLLGIKRGINIVIYVSIILLFYLLFRLYVKIDTMNQDITKIVREIALQKEVKKKK